MDGIGTVCRSGRDKQGLFCQGVDIPVGDRGRETNEYVGDKGYKKE